MARRRLAEGKFSRMGTEKLSGEAKCQASNFAESLLKAVKLVYARTYGLR
ncbi:MAG: hypothetical protein LBB18_00485 [Puniceicoccales bacterium]|nr:hypothetical protein [Puniceicoccales bacterium]